MPNANSVQSSNVSQWPTSEYPEGTFGYSNGTQCQWLVAKPSGGTLYRIKGFNAAKAGYLHLFDQPYTGTGVSTPQQGGVSILAIPVDGAFDIDFGARGRVFQNSIAMAFCFLPQYTTDPNCIANALMLDVDYA